MPDAEPSQMVPPATVRASRWWLILTLVALFLGAHLFRYAPMDVEQTTMLAETGGEMIRTDAFVWDRWRQRLCSHSRVVRRGAGIDTLSTRDFDVTVFTCYAKNTPSEALRLLRQQLEQEDFP
jgi:hypothetical protein